MENDLTIEWALLSAIHQGGLKAMNFAVERGLEPRDFGDPTSKVYRCFELFQAGLEKGVLPSAAEIKLKTGFKPSLVEDDFDLEERIKDVLTASLRERLRDGIEPLPEIVKADPEKALEIIGTLYDELKKKRSVAKVHETTDPAWGKTVIERYERAEKLALEGKIVGLTSPWSIYDEASLGLQPGQLTCIAARTKFGKCVSGDTLVRNPRTGELTKIEEFVHLASGMIHTWNEFDGSLKIVKPNAYIDSGSKECLEIRWKSGRRLTATPEHPLMTPRGWKRLDELIVGHHTAALARIPSPMKTTEIKDDEVKIIAYMIADGGCTGPSTPTFTKQDKTIVDELGNAVSTFSCSLNKINNTERSPSYTVISSEPRNQVVALLKKHGLLGKKSVDKTLPDFVFRLDDRQLGIFIGRLWSCDGSIMKSGTVSYSSGSRKLMNQLQHILLRFGVRSRIHEKVVKKFNPEGVTYYEMNIYREDIDDFNKNVELVGEKSEKVKSIKFQGASRIGWIKNEELRDLIDHEINMCPKLMSHVVKRVGYSISRNSLFSSTGRIRRAIFDVFCEVYKSPLAWVRNSSIDWDEIVSIEPVGVQHVYDLTVLSTGCFIANDVIVHNTYILLKWLQHIEKMELKPGEKALFVSLETGEDVISRRYVAIHEGLNDKDLQRGTMQKHQRDRFYKFFNDRVEFKDKYPTVTFLYGDAIKSVRDVVRYTKLNNPKVVFIDAFYFLAGALDHKLQDWQKLQILAEQLHRDLAEACNVPVVITHQLSGKKSKWATDVDSDDLSRCKAISHSASAMLALLATKEMWDENQRVIRTLDARNFEGVDFKLHFNLEIMAFDEIGKWTQPAEEEEK